MAISIPNIFIPDTLILSEEVNENFAELGQRALNTAGDRITGNIEVDGGITIDGVDISEALGLAGNLNITSIHLSGNADIDGNLNVDGTTTLNILTVTGLTTLNTLVVNGTSNLKGAVTLDTTLSVAGTLTVTGLATFNNSITVPVGEVYVGSWFREAGRTTPLGHWATEPFLAANFTASTGTWTLTSPDQVVFRYTLVGKTMHVAFSFDNTSVSGGTSTLNVKIPGGKTAAAGATGRGVIDYIDAGTGGLIGNCTVLPSDTLIRMIKSGASPWSTATNNTDVRGSITFEIA